MKKSTYVWTVILVLVALISAPLLYVFVGPQLTDLQIKTLLILLIIMGCSVLFCFVVGQLTHNNSQMDKLWSLLPIAYTWVIAFMGNLNTRLVIIAILVTLWGLRLTMNFARKGAYKLKFWEGEEDYRWRILRESPTFKGHKVRWALFNLFFISFYQNVIVLLITLPALAVMESVNPVGLIDFIAMGLTFFFIIYETIADEQQWKFQTEKYAMLKTGLKLEELPEPYNKGFNTVGLWNHSRHPNYFAEQSIWVCIYLFTIGANIGYSWSFMGALLLIVLFIGSSNMGESISLPKYPEYATYQEKCSKFLPFRKYR